MAVENLLECDLNPFEIFELDLSFDIDFKILDKKYFDLQKKNHPDYLANDEIKLFYKAQAINAAYKTLKDPIERLKSLVLAKGGDLNAKPSVDFLEMCLDDCFDFSFEFEKRIKSLIIDSNISIKDLEKSCSELIYLNRKIQ